MQIQNPFHPFACQLRRAAALAIFGGLAHAACLAANLPLNLDQPLTLKEVGYLPSTESQIPRELFVQDGVLYLWDTYHGPVVSHAVDISNVAAMRFIAAPTPLAPRTVDGSRFYSQPGPGSSRLSAFDNRNPARPVNVGVLSDRLNSRSIFIQNNRAYDVESPTGPGQLLFRINDVTDPAHPVLLGSLLDDYSSYRAISAPDERGILWFTDSQWDGTSTSLRLNGMNVSNPANPAVAGRYTFAPAANGTVSYSARIGNAIYISSGTGMQVLDATQPANIVKVRTLSSTAAIESITAGPNHRLYYRTANSIVIMDATDPLNPIERGTIAQTRPDAFQGIVDAADNNTYFTFNNFAVEAFDVSNPAAPIKRTLAMPSVKPAFHTQDIEVIGSTAYVAVNGTGSNAEGLLICDLSNPAAPVQLGLVRVENGAYAVRVIGNRAYLLSSFSLHIIDVSIPTAPRRLASVPVSLSHSMEINGDHLFPGAYWPPLKIINIADPTAAFESYSDGNLQRGTFHSAGQRAVWSGDTSIVFDLSNPEHIVPTDTFPGNTLGVFANKAYVLRDDQLVTMDISVSPALQLASIPVDLPNDHSGWDYVTFIKDKYFVVNGGRYVEIFDISNPAAPRFVQQLIVPASSMPGTVNNIDLEGNRLYAAGNADGIKIFDLVPTTVVADDFSDGNDDGWLRWSPFAAFGAPASFAVENGVYRISSPRSPAPQVLYTYAGAAHVELNLTTVQAQADVSGWLAGPDDSSGIALQVRAQVHPDGIASWYSATLTPRPLALAEGTPYSTHPGFAIVKVIRNIPTVLATQAFGDMQFDATKTYTITLSAEGTRLFAQLYENDGAAKTSVSELIAFDSDLDHGYVGLNSYDRLGLIAKGNSPIQFTVDNFKVEGIDVPPTISLNGASVYWSAGATQKGYILESSTSLPGNFGPVAEPIVSGTDGFIRMITPARSEPIRFFQLRKP